MNAPFLTDGGEDLHTFESRVIHCGITWTPSAMEQRTGCVDRMGSLTHRRPANSSRPEADRILQVQSPDLESTVELVQIQEIVRRMDEFVAVLQDPPATAPSSVVYLDGMEIARRLIEHRLRCAFAPMVGVLPASN